VGSRTDDKLKEIDELRDGLSRKLGELEGRFPLAGLGKKVALGLVGSSVATPVLGFGLRRLRGGKKKSKKEKEAPVVQPVVVSAFPKSLTLVAVVGIAAWAGTKVYDTYMRTKETRDGAFKPSVVHMPEGTRQSGAGTSGV
jgi:hypothetical protein